MKLTKKIENEIWKVYDTWLNSYLNGDVKTYNKYLDKDYHFIGSTANEEFLNKKDTTNFFKATADQLAGKCDLRNETRIIENFDGLVFITHLFDAWFKNGDDWSYYGRFRFSNALKNNKEGWRFIYQHFSTTDSKTDEGETIGFDKVSVENQELREAIKRRTFELEQKNRELEIETALEKVRSRTMAMQHSEELQEASFLLDQQVRALGIKTWGCAFNIYGENDSTEWFGNEAGVLPTYRVPHKGIFKTYYQKGQKGESLFIQEFSGKACIDHYEYISSLPIIGDVLKTLKETNDGFPMYQIDHVVYFKYGYLLFITREAVPDAYVIFKRFAKVFEQTYTRFLDLQKAEAQTKEAQIETALERVRSRAMAMHGSRELLDVIAVIAVQLSDLKIKYNNVSFGSNVPSEKIKFWTAAVGLSRPMYMEIPAIDNPAPVRIWEAQKKGEKFFADILTTEENRVWTEHVIKYSDLKLLPDEMKNYILDSVGFARSAFILKNINLYVGNYQARLYTDEENDIIGRFAQVFEQSYTRFIDLQKAEAQAREAQIEAALEKVRSSSLAVHKIDEFNKVVKVIFERLDELNIPAYSVTMMVPKVDTKDWDVFGCGVSNSGLVTMKFQLPYFPSVMMDDLKQLDSQSEASYSTKIYTEAEKNQYYEYVFNNTELKNLPDDIKQQVWQSTSYAVSIASAKNSMIVVNDFEGHILDASQAEILKRFSKVFEQAYIRFMDLQKAEAQARESQIEASLERVRSRTMAMHNSDELGEVAAVLFEQVSLLTDTPNRFNIGIINESKKTFDIWVTDQEGKNINNLFVAEVNKSPIIKKIFEAWKADDKRIIQILKGKQLENWVAYMSGEVGIPFDKKRISKQRYINSIFFKQGFMGITTSEPIEENTLMLLERFTAVFQQTYTRFLDLQKAEAQARESQIEAALEKVRSRTMAMQHSEELPEAANVLFTEVQNLGVPAWSCGYNILSTDKKSSTCIMSSEGEIQSPFILPLTEHKSLKPWHKAILNNEQFFVYEQGGKDLEEHYNYMQSLPDLKDTFQQLREAAIPLPTFQVNHLAKFTNGFLLFITYERVPDTHNIFQRFAKVFEQTYTRFLDLQKAETQARKAQIEAALERTRTQSMLMQRSEELDATSKVFHEQLQLLGIDTEFSYVWLPDDTNNEHQFWVAWNAEKKGDTSIKSKAIVYPLDKTEPYTANCFKDWASGVPVHIHHIKPKEVATFFSAWEELLKDAKNLTPKYFSNGLYYAEAFMKYGCFGINIKRAITEEENQILQRFSIEFERTYTRFLDLQKAEAQTRNAQINLAVERVRAKALAMHKSEEIMKVVAKLKEEVMALDIPDVIAATIFLNEGEDKVRMWDLSSLEENNNGYEIPFDITFKLKKRDPNLYIKRVWENQGDYFLEKQEAKDFKRIIAWLRENNKLEVANEVEEFIETTKLKRLHHAVKKLNNGKLVIDLLNEPSDEMETILTKMGAAFDLAYKRFEDLQKAEAQSRESQIEAALEKVRSRSLAMHKPDELQEVVAVVAEKLHELGVIFDAGGVILCTYFPDNKDVVHWIAVDDFSNSGRYFVPYFDNPIFSEAWDSKIRGDAYFSKEFPVEAKNDFFKQAFEHSDYKHMPEDYKQYVLKADKHFLSAAWSKNSAIVIPSLTGAVPSESDAEIIKRFAKVFEQAYIRFMDLQKAEERAREIQIDIALERVRSRTLAMQTSEELAETSMVVFQQLVELGIAPNRLFIGIIKDKETSVEAWATNEDGSKIASQFTLQASKNKSIKKMITGWKEDKKSLVIDMKGKELQDYFQYLNKEMNIPFIHGLEQKRRVQTLAYFSEGLIGMAAPDEQSEDSIRLLERFASVFNLTYTRFKDLKVAEAQAKKAEEDLINLQLAKKSAENALSELQQTQTQLIQSEKMASLGELTAGIAHEIQNPLNFVNNFSEVSKELLDEMLEELENGDMEEVRAIMDDVIQNLEKINHHGKRADGIVKGMLQHSRSSTGTKELTNINVLADEYLRLAYHGLRAKDKSFNANLVTDFDEEIGKINVIPQDIGRVILNLITNAFYACNERSKAISAIPKSKNNGILTYEPIVRVSTNKENKKVEIKVTDNGNGIPKKVIDKIFQPFFTTKPTGQGTGLGLSLSYDIVKAHNGDLLVETEDNIGTTFKIVLPIS